MIDKPVNFRDLFDCKPIEPARLSDEERRKFVEEVQREMDRNGFTRANELTAKSERLTEQDYSIVVY